MHAVIFAAGLGTRLRPLTDTLPKPMIDVGGKPILRHTLEAMPSSISDVIIVVGYKGGIIRKYLEDSSIRLNIGFVEQTELRGTHDALMRAAGEIVRPDKNGGMSGGPFLALNGDDLYAREDLERLAAQEGWAMLSHRVPAPNPYSHLETEAGCLKRIVLQKDSEALTEKEVYVGACLLDGRFFGLDPALTPGGEAGLPQTLEKHLNKIPVRVLESSFWLPVGTPEELERARSVMAEA